MHAPLRLSLPAVLLLAGTSLAWAQSSLPDPVAPAVLGRPLSQIRPAHGGHEKHASATSVHPRHEKHEKHDKRDKHDKRVAARPVMPRLAQVAAPGQHAAKQALDDRVDPRVRVDDVGQGTHFARKPLGTGVYIGDRHRDAVLKYFAQHPAPAAGANWKIGEPLPAGAQVSAVPPGLLADLPRTPPGYRYVQLGGDLVMIAAQSRLVVDGVSRTQR